MWKSILDVLVTNDKHPAEAKPAPAATPARSLPVGTVVDAPVGNGNVIGSVLDVEGLEKQIDDLVQANPNFAPYLEFMKVADAIKGVISEEGLRYKTAQATTKVDAQVLVGGIKNACELVLTEREQDFEVNYCAVASADVTELGKQADALGIQIHDLTEQLGKVSDQRSALIKSASTKASDLAKAKIDFASVCKTIETRYQDVTSKVQQYLGGV
jgi:hypothetical protein